MTAPDPGPARKATAAAMSAGLASWRTGICSRYRWRISSSVMPASAASTRSCSVSMKEGRDRVW